jgi:hypothetical protein
VQEKSYRDQNEMCEIRILVVGNSERHNLEAIKTIEDKCRQESQGKARLSCDGNGATSLPDTNIDDYDLVAVDDSIVPTAKGRLLMSFDTPVVVFSDLTGNPNGAPEKRTGMVISSVIAHVVARGNLRDKLAMVTEEIEQTSRLLAAVN